jgi:hypothetical protein
MAAMGNGMILLADRVQLRDEDISAIPYRHRAIRNTSINMGLTWCCLRNIQACNKAKYLNLKTFRYRIQSSSDI